ncbi:MAG: EamA family transporter [Cyanobacteria bacterium]|jgi:drug/metabolite transporter (DMT)-like permease|nr:EamA family transporter [Cyanobacteria bacterium GSL.Bin1]
MPEKLISVPKISRPPLIAFLTLCFALLAVSFAPIFIRLSETELGANATVFNRLIVFFIFFGSGRWVKQKLSSTSEENSEQITGQQWWLLGSVGTIAAISLVLWAISLQYTTVAKSVLLNNLTPIFTALGSWLLFGKQFDSKFLVGMTIAVAGAITLGLEDLNAAAEGSLIGDVYALLSAVFLGTYFLIVEQLRSRFSATTILLWRCATGSALLVIIMLLTGEQLFPTTQIAIFAVLGLGLISEGLGQRLLADSMNVFSSSFVSLFLLLEPIVSAILAWFIFTEGLTITTWLGFAVVLTGIYLAQTSKAANSDIVDNNS